MKIKSLISGMLFLLLGIGGVLVFICSRKKDSEKETANDADLIWEKTNNRQGLTSVVKLNSNGEYYYIDSAWTFDQGYELMIFSYDMETRDVVSWHDLYSETFDNADDMLARHRELNKSLTQQMLLVAELLDFE